MLLSAQMHGGGQSWPWQGTAQCEAAQAAPWAAGRKTALTALKGILLAWQGVLTCRILSDAPG